MADKKNICLNSSFIRIDILDKAIESINRVKWSIYVGFCGGNCI